MTSNHTTNRASACRPRSPFSVVLRALIIAGCGVFLTVRAQAQYDPKTGRLKKENQRLEDLRNDTEGKKRAAKEESDHLFDDYGKKERQREEELRRREERERLTPEQRARNLQEYLKKQEEEAKASERALTERLREQREKAENEEAAAWCKLNLYPEMRGAFRVDLSKVDKLIATGNEDFALRLLRWLSGQNNPEAQYEMAKIYFSGRLRQSSGQWGQVDIGADPKKAVYFLQVATNFGSRGPAMGRAVAALGEAYAKGNGVAQDFGKALELFQSAGRVPAAFIGLGHLYEQGLGVPKDPEKAQMYFVGAASLGAYDFEDHKPFDLHIPTNERDRIRQIPDRELAVVFARLGSAFAQGDAVFAARRVDWDVAYVCYMVAGQLAGSAQYDAARDEAAAKIKSSRVGLDVAPERLGHFADQWSEHILWGWEENAAVGRWRLMARLGSRNAQRALGMIFEEGRNGMPRDLVSAYAWYAIAEKDSLQHGSAANRLKLNKAELALAEFKTGELYASELVVPLGMESEYAKKAFQRYANAAENGHREAHNRLGAAYEKGLGVAKDPAMAQHWYRWAQMDDDAVRVERSNTLRTRERSDKLAEKLQKYQENYFKLAHEEVSVGLNQVTLLTRDGLDDQALELLRWWAERNNGEAQYKLAKAKTSGRLRAGDGTSGQTDIGVDLNEAAQWLRKAAAAGYLPAQVELGEAYAKGAGLPQDFGQARQWFQAAGYYEPEACLALGHLYAEGLGGPKDAELANMWFVCAASFGPSPAASFKLPAAERDFLRKISNRDLATAFARLGAAFAGSAAGNMRNWRNAYLCYVAAAQFSRDGQYDAACAEAAGKLKDDEAYTYMAFSDFKSRWAETVIYEKDGPTAVNWCRVLAGLGDMGSRSCLGRIFESGTDGVSRNLVSAHAWYAIAAYSKWDEPRIVKIGQDSVSMFLGGPGRGDLGGVERTSRLLTKKELAEAQFLVGEFFRAELRVTAAMWGQDVDPKKEAARWYSVAAENGNKKAQFRLGTAYEKGIGIAQDQNAAKKWYRTSGLKRLD